MSGWRTDTVLMPVPLELAQRVAEYVASLEEAVSSAAPERNVDRDEAATAVVPGQGSWTETMVHQLADSLTYEGVIALLDRCADEPEHWVVKSAVEEANAISPIQLRNELGALSKLTKRLFGGAPTWPMQWRKGKGKYYYRMDSQVADWWLAARAGGRR